MADPAAGGKAHMERLRHEGVDVLEVQDHNQLLLDDDHILAQREGTSGQPVRTLK